MDADSVSRRDFVSVVSGAAASGWILSHAGVADALEFAAQSAPQDKYTALSAAQVRELDAVTSTLVPSDGTPGAKEAKVVRFIDRSLATWAAEQKPNLEKSLAALTQFVAEQRPGTATFAALAPADRIAVLEAFEKAHGDDFGGLFFPTMMGMFANPSYGGNANKVGWQLMGFKDQFSWSTPFGYYDRG